MAKAVLIVVLILLVTWSIHLAVVQRLDETIRDRAMAYYRAHQDTIANRRYLTVIDFTRPSYACRLHILDLETGEENRHLVAHGENSGYIYATELSNRIGSHQSCQGFFLTGDAYQGEYGPALLLHGLEAEVNDNALRRDIVLHGASWVSYGAIFENGGRLGRSWGCPAVPQDEAEDMVDKLKGGSLLYVYSTYGPSQSGNISETVVEQEKKIRRSDPGDGGHISLDQQGRKADHRRGFPCLLGGRAEFLSRQPSVCAPGGSTRFHLSAFRRHVFSVVGCIPIEYLGGDLFFLQSAADGFLGVPDRITGRSTLSSRRYLTVDDTGIDSFLHQIFHQ
jgi:hypothetical protein